MPRASQPPTLPPSSPQQRHRQTDIEEHTPSPYPYAISLVGRPCVIWAIDHSTECGLTLPTHSHMHHPGREVREQMFEEVTELLHDLDEGMVPLSVIAPYAPIAAHKKRDM